MFPHEALRVSPFKCFGFPMENFFRLFQKLIFFLKTLNIITYMNLYVKRAQSQLVIICPMFHSILLYHTCIVLSVSLTNINYLSSM